MSQAAAFLGEAHCPARGRNIHAMRMQDMRAKLGQQLATGQREGLRPGMLPPDVDPEKFAGLSFSLARRTPLRVALTCMSGHACTLLSH